jgi:hypothetical protein
MLTKCIVFSGVDATLRRILSMPCRMMKSNVRTIEYPTTQESLAMTDLIESLKGWIDDPERYASESRAAVLVGLLRPHLEASSEVCVALQVLSVAKMWRDSFTHSTDTAALLAKVITECEEKGMSILEAKAVMADYFARGLQAIGK